MIYIVDNRDIIGQDIGAIHSWPGARPLQRINQIRWQILFSIFPLGFIDDTKEETWKLLQQIGDTLLPTCEKAQ